MVVVTAGVVAGIPVVTGVFPMVWSVALRQSVMLQQFFTQLIWESFAQPVELRSQTSAHLTEYIDSFHFRSSQ